MRSAATTTDGWRGRPGPDWSELDLLAAVAHAADTGALGSSVLIGYDTRAGSAQIATLIASLLRIRNVSCKLADGPAPTPAAGRYAHSDPDLTGAVIVTASHNPPGYTGVKLRDANGLGTAWPQPPDRLAIDLDSLSGHASQHHATAPVAGHYAATIGRELERAVSRFSGTVIIDAAHGAVGALAGHLPSVRWARAMPLPFFGGRTPDPTLIPDASDIAGAALRGAADPRHTVTAMVDGDGDRLVLHTAASGCIGSAEQAALLISAGLPVEHFVTSVVAPRMAIRAASQRNPPITITQVPVGFKHQVTTWLQAPDRATLGMEPNGAFAWAPDSSGYFERDSLAALTSLLTIFPSADALDDAATALRHAYPHPQRILATPKAAERVVTDLSRCLAGWRHDTVAMGLDVFDDGEDGWIAIRASGTEPITRLYVEASPATRELLRESLS